MSANSLDTYVKNVLTYTSAGSGAELAELNRKAVADVLEKNVSHLNRVLETLSVEDHSLSVTAILLAKMNHANTSEKLDRTLTQVEMSLPLLDKAQINLAPDIFAALFQRVYQACLGKGELGYYMRGITLLTTAVEILADGPGELTSLHACLLCLCLKIRWYEPIQQIIETPILKIRQEAVSGPAMDAQWVLLYFYYGALIFGSMSRFRECLSMLQNVLCIPATATSAIMVEAYKKYVLVSLVVHNKVLPLPHSRTTVTMRSIKNMCPDYGPIEGLCHGNNTETDPANAVLQYLESKRSVFEKDGNVALVKQLVRKIRERSVINITKCFVTISLADFARRCHFDSEQHAESYLVDMNAEGKICGKIDKRLGVVHFSEAEAEVSEETLDSYLGESVRLCELLKDFDERLRTNPAYIVRSMKSSLFPTAHDDEGFQQGGSPGFTPLSFSSFSPYELLLPS